MLLALQGAGTGSEQKIKDPFSRIPEERVFIVLVSPKDIVRQNTRKVKENRGFNDSLYTLLKRLSIHT